MSEIRCIIVLIFFKISDLTFVASEFNKIPLFTVKHKRRAKSLHKF